MLLRNSRPEQEMAPLSSEIRSEVGKSSNVASEIRSGVGKRCDVASSFCSGTGKRVDVASEFPSGTGLSKSPLQAKMGFKGVFLGRCGELMPLGRVIERRIPACCREERNG